MKDCYNFYVKCDILFLAYKFEKFRNSNFKNYGLCPSYYLSAPALCWDAMFNMTKFELEFTSNTDMFLFFEKGMRGEVSYFYKIL